MSKKNYTQRFFVDGMHCASCELLIEKSILKLDDVKSVDASLQNNVVELSMENHKKVSVDDINQVCKGLGYTFSREKIKKEHKPLFYFMPDQAGIKVDWTQLKKRLEKPIILLLIVIVLRWAGSLELGRFMSTDGSETILGILILGLVASVSSCAALIGGLLLSLTKQWNDQLIDEKNLMKKAKPHIGFHIGRVGGFIFLGGVLGLIGNAISFDDPTVFAVLVLVISVVMVSIAFQMLGVKAANRIRFRLPRFLSGFAINQSNNTKAPALIGASTFFLPCGFTLIAQGIALASGSLITGAVIMGTFAIGTLPALLVISFAGLQMNKKPHLTAKFNFASGILILVFALYNINGQLNVLGWTSFSDLSAGNTFGSQQEPVENIEGYQEVKLVAKGFNYIPSGSTSVQAGTPTKLVVDNQGVQGCGSYLMVSGLMTNFVALRPGQNIIDLGVPKKGKYKITCSMGMVPPITLNVI